MTEEENSGNQGIKVQDRRRFNADGTVVSEARVQATAEPKPTSDESSDAREFPADFASLLLSLATGAQAALGVAPNPVSGKVEKNLQQAKYGIDLLGILEEKTRGNLTPEETKLMRVLLDDLRLRYVDAKK